MWTTPRSHDRTGIENTTLEECHDICKTVSQLASKPSGQPSLTHMHAPTET